MEDAIVTTLLKTTAAAEHINTHPRTMTGWRGRGVGPPYFRIEGMVLYALSDLDTWLESRRCVPARRPGPSPTKADPKRHAEGAAA